MNVEICANSLQSAIHAEQAGADRIELCSELAVGGVTPSYGLLKAVSEKITIPVRVLLRPRSGHFSYSEDEFTIIKKDIRCCAEMGFEGVVIGMLTPNFEIDKPRILALQEMNHGLQMTFHRAFDWVQNPFKAFAWLQGNGIDTILTSGQQQKAIDGIELLADLNALASTTVVMPGSGINARNAQIFKKKGFQTIHLSAVKMNQNLNVNPKVAMNSPQMLSDVAVPISNKEIISEVIMAVK